MKAFSLSSFLALAALATSSFAVIPISSIQRTSSSNIVPGKFIIEVTDASLIPGKRSLDPREVHESVYESLRSRRVGFRVNHEFTAGGLFTGASVTLDDPKDISQLQDTAGVVAVRPVILIPAPKPVKSHVVTGRNDPQIPPDSQSTHILTGVDKLHAQGVFGKGIKIGIIDTGIDYTHPQLGGAIGPGNKVIGGFDLVGDDYNGQNTPVPDPDPLDQCNGHGTHVAGIIGVDPQNEFNISGVAFEASLAAYRVFGCDGSVTDDVLVEALIRAFVDGMDIITMSLGGADGWTEGTSTVVSSRLAEAGKVLTIAAGNDGNFGSWYTSGPGNAIDAISVASTDNTVILLQNATVSGVQHDPIPYFETFPLKIDGEFPIFATSTDITVPDDACNPLPDSTPDLSGFLTVIRRGTCSFVQKLTNAADKGAKVVFIYDNGNGFAAIDTGTFDTATLIQAVDGEFLVQQFAAGADLKISFPQSGASFNFPDDAGGLVSSFTSYGPSNDMFFKPAVAAPGGNILSTLPVTQGSFGVLSGTSMATPFVAGSAALLLSVKGTSRDVALSARNLFETTAQPVASSHTDSDPLQTLTQQGAGLINVFNAVRTTTIVTPGEFNLNDTANFDGARTFSIRNTGRTPKTFRISHVPVGTAITVTPGTIFPVSGPVPLSRSSASVRFSRSRVTVGPGQTARVTATFTPPRNVDQSTFPVYAGFIQIKSSTETLHVSYQGVAAALRDKQVVDDTDFFFGVPLPLIIDSLGFVQEDTQNYTFADGDFPSILSRLAFGTPLLRIDLVEPNVKIQTTIRPEGGSGPVRGRFDDVPIAGTLFDFQFISRNTDGASAADNAFNLFPVDVPEFIDGTPIPSGSYRILFRALRVTGNRNREADFDSWLSPIVGVFPS